ncbi:YlxR family protein [Nocardioides gilvus]|uniref:YlxR family protein n=1 Tax=Nocardioides gilvus TaxID=1735589 RepID=UPI000D7406AF|nr:YlxR family protein [Nocardioides gilvus]
MVRAPNKPSGRPFRTCVGCRARVTKSELLRVVVGPGPDGRKAVIPDPPATAPGRGAHLHPTIECHELAVRRRAYSRALRAGEGLVLTPLEEFLNSSPESPMNPTNHRPEIGAGSS